MGDFPTEKPDLGVQNPGHDKFFKTLFENAYQQMLVLDAEGTVVTVNKSALNLTGMGETDIIGKQVWMIPWFNHSFNDEHEIQDAVGRAAEGEVIQFEMNHSIDQKETHYFDCTLKPVKHEVNDSVSIILEGWNVTKLKNREQQLQDMIMHDELTGLPNRRLLKDRMNKAVSRARRHSTKMAILFLDLDGFKEINDTYGHACGDFLLCQLAHRLTHSIRGIDSIARLCGDEFILLLEEINSYECVVQICERVIEVISIPFILFKKQEVEITASIGVSFFPDDVDEEDKLLHFADQAMYDAKRAGKNGFSFYKNRKEN